jgi:hypothetical protein
LFRELPASSKLRDESIGAAGCLIATEWEKENKERERERVRVGETSARG